MFPGICVVLQVVLRPVVQCNARFQVHRLPTFLPPLAPVARSGPATSFGSNLQAPDAGAAPHAACVGNERVLPRRIPRAALPWQAGCVLPFHRLHPCRPSPTLPAAWQTRLAGETRPFPVVYERLRKSASCHSRVSREHLVIGSMSHETDAPFCC